MEQHNFLKEWQCKTVPLLWTDSQSALAVCRRRGPGRMKHVELKMLAVQEWLKTGRLRVRKGSTHDNPANLMTKAMSREKLIKFGRALNLTRITLHRLEPTCTAATVATVTSATSDIALLSAETYTVDSFQHLRRATHGERSVNDYKHTDSESMRHNHLPQTMLGIPRNAVTYAAPISVVEYDAPAPILEYAASVTTMTVPTTVVTQPEKPVKPEESETHGSDYFNSSVTYDVQTALVRCMLWPESDYNCFVGQRATTLCWTTSIWTSIKAILCDVRIRLLSVPLS